MKYFAVVKDGWVVSQGFGSMMPEGAIELDEPLPSLHHAQDANGALRAAPQPSRLHRRAPGGRWIFDVEEAWSEVRSERNRRLSESDWVTLPDVPLSTEEREAWTKYRQALRDITKQPNPIAIAWPVPPGKQ